MTADRPQPTHEQVSVDTAAVLAAAPIEPGMVRAHRLFRGAGVTVMGIAIDAGAVMKEHVAPAPILVQVIDGRIAFDVEGERFELPVGGMLHVAERVPHAVEALEPSRFLLMLLGTNERRARP